MRWFKWLQKKPAMDERAQRKRDQVLVIMPDLEHFIVTTRRQVVDRDMMIPRRYTYYTLYILGAIEALGESESFDEAQHLAGLLMFLQKHAGMDAQGVSGLMGQCMSHQDTQEGMQARQAGGEAILAWQGGDADAVNRLAGIFAQMD